jgi:phenylalanyl-tRNA synthetase beta chain
MPTLTVERDLLYTHLGRTYTDEAFDELCFEFGIELDEITSQRDEAVKSAGTTKLSKQVLEQYSSAIIYKIDMPANRYDLLCVEGLSRALKIFLGDIDAPVYSKAEPTLTMTVLSYNTSKIRPYVVCAVLRNVKFDAARYASFIDLQDQLHRNLCRQRTLVAIGTHDLDAIAPPFVYDAMAPQDIEFIPLTPNHQSFTADLLMEYYETEPSAKHLKPYVPIIKNSPVYPVIRDSEGTVLSLPPIINGDKSKITLNTTNVFIECTATDLTKANIVLDTVVTMFSEYCTPTPYVVEGVTVNYVDANDVITNTYVSPSLSTRRERVSVEFCNSLIGIQLPADTMRTLCTKVQLGPAMLLENDTILEVTVPPTRSDILHAVDIAEDIGIAYGYNNIVRRVPTTSTVGSEQPLNLLTDLLRDEIGRAGYIEVLTHGLCSQHDNFTALGRPITAAVSLSNPANIEYQVVRTTLLPGLLKTLQHNKSASFTNGFKLFEISDVVLVDNQHVVAQTIVGARNARRVCAVYAGPTSGFEVIHGLVDRIMTLTEVAPDPTYIANSAKSDEEKFRVSRDGWKYTIAPLPDTDPCAKTYFPGRAASILLTSPKSGHEAVSIGSFGILHPSVLSQFDIQYPASCVELDLEALVSSCIETIIPYVW